jgi:hypothetical protein
VNLYLLCLRLWLTCHLLSATCCCRLYLLQFSRMSHHTHLVQLALFRALLDACPFSFLQCRALPASCNCCPCLVSVQVLLLHSLAEHPQGEVFFSLSPDLRDPHTLCYMSFSQLFVYYSVFFLQGVGQSVCGGYADLSQGWLWEYHMLLICSPVGLHFPSRLVASAWQHRSPPGFSI